MAIRSDVSFGRLSRARVRLPAAGIFMAASLAAAVASADGPLILSQSKDEGFIQPAPTVQSRIFKLSGKNEIGVLGAFSVNNVLAEHYGGALTWDYNFNEYLALEILAGGGLGALTYTVTNPTAGVRAQSDATYAVKVTDLANGGALMAYGQLGVRFTPLYGKFNLASELPVHFDIYFNLGAGAAMVDYNSILGCTDASVTTPATCPGNHFHQEQMPAFAFGGGGGIRLFITQMISVRVEVRDIVFPDRYYTNLNPAAAGNGFTNNNLVSNPGLTQVPLVLAGVGFLL